MISIYVIHNHQPYVFIFGYLNIITNPLDLTSFKIHYDIWPQSQVGESSRGFTNSICGLEALQQQHPGHPGERPDLEVRWGPWRYPWYNQDGFLDSSFMMISWIILLRVNVYYIYKYIHIHIGLVYPSVMEKLIVRGKSSPNRDIMIYHGPFSIATLNF